MKDKIMMPAGGAGITRYFEESKSKVQIKPAWIIISGIIICITILALSWLI